MKKSQTGPNVFRAFLINWNVGRWLWIDDSRLQPTLIILTEQFYLYHFSAQYSSRLTIDRPLTLWTDRKTQNEKKRLILSSSNYVCHKSFIFRLFLAMSFSFVLFSVRIVFVRFSVLLCDCSLMTMTFYCFDVWLWTFFFLLLLSLCSRLHVVVCAFVR